MKVARPAIPVLAFIAILALDSCSSDNATVVSGPGVHDTLVVRDTVILRDSTSFCPTTLTWTEASTGITNFLFDGQMLDRNNLVAVGARGAIITSSDGGASWTKQQSGVSGDLYGVRFRDRNNGIAIGDGSAILSTSDGGVTWSKQTAPVDSKLRGLTFIDAMTAIIVGTDNNGTVARIFRTSDGGATWSTVMNNSNSAGLYGVSFATPTVGTVTGKKGVIFRTTDAGLTWMEQTAGVSADIQLNDVSMTTAAIGVAVGGEQARPTATILRTTNGGTTWNQQPNNIGEFLYKILFTSRHLGIASGFHGTLLRTTDGGESWAKDSLPTDARLTGLSFIDDSTGMVVGDVGTVFLLHRR